VGESAEGKGSILGVERQRRRLQKKNCFRDVGGKEKGCVVGELAEKTSSKLNTPGAPLHESGNLRRCRLCHETRRDTQ